MHIRYGYNRIVFVIGTIAVKIPNLLNGDRGFSHGLVCNLNESELFKQSSGDNRIGNVKFCAWFGVFLIMQRYSILSRALTDIEVSALPITNPDPKIGNYSMLDDGTIVVVDYGHCNTYYRGKDT